MTFYKFSVGVVLAVAMIAVLGFSAVVFSARDFQFGVAQISPSTNGLISFQRLADVDRQVAQIQNDSAGPRGEQLQLQAQVADLTNQAQSTEAAANEARANIVGGIAEVEQHAQVQPVESAAADLSTQALTSRINTLAGHTNLSPADQQHVAALSTQITQLQTQDASTDDSGAQRATLEGRMRLVGAQVADADRRIFALQQSVVPDYEHYGRVSNEAHALTTLSPLGISAYMAQGHPALLSTFLVLLMGALGSLLYLFPAYLNRPQPVTMAEIVVRLIFGMCAALAFYVLANAAIAGFSIGSSVQQATTSSALNPFTVSLVGIVAGVLSEDIAHWIQERGRGIFTQGGLHPPAAAPAPSPTGGLVNNQAIS